MVLDQVSSQLSTFYCLCSEMRYEEILEKQKEKPLEFKHFLDSYTKCNQGCGSCIDNLKKYLVEMKCFVK